MRSIVSQEVHILALTATATSDVFKAVKKRLCLEDPALVGLSPSRENIKYYVEPLPSIKTLSDLMSSSLLSLRSNFPKTLIFCHTIAECASMYQCIRRTLGNHFTEPSGYPDYHQFRLVDMYTRASSEEMKKKVLASFMTAESKLRIVVATTAFGMGVDFPNIQNVIHYSPPASIEQYVQETGRAGRNGLPATALLLYNKPGKYLEKTIAEYCSNPTECRRNFLFRNFLFYVSLNMQKCKCCDICATNCDCIDCVQQ